MKNQLIKLKRIALAQFPSSDVKKSLTGTGREIPKNRLGFFVWQV